MTGTHSITHVQLITGAVLDTNAMDHDDALHERTRIEQAMCKPHTDPTLRFPHRSGTRIIATAHITQTWITPVTVIPAKRPDPEA